MWTRRSGPWRPRAQWAPGRGTCWCSPTSWCTGATPTPQTGETPAMCAVTCDMWAGRGGCSSYRWRPGRTPQHLTSTGWPLTRTSQTCFSPCMFSQIAMRWHGIERNKPGSTCGPGQKTWKLKSNEDWDCILLENACSSNALFDPQLIWHGYCSLKYLLIMRINLSTVKISYHSYRSYWAPKGCRAHCMQTPGLQHSIWAEKCGKTHSH